MSTYRFTFDVEVNEQKCDYLDEIGRLDGNPLEWLWPDLVYALQVGATRSIRTVGVAEVVAS